MYVGKGREEAMIERTVDICRIFSTKEEALDYLNKNLDKESEGGYRYKKNIALPNASKVFVYREESMSASMYNMMKVEKAHWNFIFVIDRVVAKIFTAGEQTPITAAYEIAQEAAKHISSKLNLAVNNFTPTQFDWQLTDPFREKIGKGALDFVPLPGFESRQLPDELTRYFDQEFQWPAEKLVVRYFVVQNREEDNASLDDSVAYKKYCNLKKNGALSVTLNIIMSMPPQMPNVKEIKNRDECKKINNSDYMVQHYFRIDEASQLGKGYKYGYLYGMFKKDRPDCYVVFLSDDTKKLELFRQLQMSSIKYKE